MAASAASTPTASALPLDCYLQPQSDDEEESFVVLSRSLPPESLLDDVATEAMDTIDVAVVQESLDLISNNLSNISLSKSTSSFPSIPKMKEQNLAVVESESEIGTHTTNSSVDLSPDEIQGKLDMLIEENIRLKDTLRQNNLAMKNQYETLTLWQEDVMKVHQSHKEKFSQTKKYIENLKLDNAKLTEALKSAQAEAMKEIELLKAEKQELESSTKEQASFSLLPNKENAAELEASQRKLAELELKANTLQAQLLMKEETPLSNQVLGLQKELAECKQLHIKATSDFDKQIQQSEALQKILLDEVKTLKLQLNEKDKISNCKVVNENIQEQLMAAQMHITELELLRTKDKEIIDTKVETIAKLEVLTKEMSDTNDTITALRAQLDLYKSDFEAERQAKNSIKAEKEQIVDDLRHLQRRNEQLLKEVEQLRGNDFVHVNRPQSSVASAPQDRSKPDFCCPKCNFKFTTYQALENHVFRCLDEDF